MVCSPDDLVVWKDFPKGLRILLLEHDKPSAAETKLKLEAMDYIVSLFCNEGDALEAISKKTESFHVAIIEVTSESSSHSYRFLEMARDLPTIVMSNVQCLSTMMKCIALGAAEFLQKPISEDKLRNIWQHVVHKAFNAGGSVLTKSLKPIKETVVSMLQLQSDTAQLRIDNASEAKVKNEENEHSDSLANDKFLEPSTPWLAHGVRLLDDGDCHDQPDCSAKKEITENANDPFRAKNSMCSESKSADNTSNNLISSVTNKEVSSSVNEEPVTEEEIDSAGGSKTYECGAVERDSIPLDMDMKENSDSCADDPKKKTSVPCSSSYSNENRGNRKKMKVDWTPETKAWCSESKSADNTSNNLIGSVTNKEVSSSVNGEPVAEEEVDSDGGSKTHECGAVERDSIPLDMNKQETSDSCAEDSKKKTSAPCSSSYSNENRGNRKKMKVDWTPELHRRFVQAVEQLGVDQAIPSKILELMKVEGLTRHNVASHLQKYRMHRRYILPKDDDRRWQLQRDSLLRGYMQKPPVAIPSYHSNYSFPPRQVYPIWGHQSYHPSGIQMWGHASYPTWLQPPENWLWKTYPVIGADAWGCPVIPPYSQFPIPSQSISVSSGVDVIEDRERVSKDSYDHLAEEVIDEAVKEAMSKPWLPLPLGLKPPSTDSVLSELHHQGIHTVPPPHCSSRQ